MHSNSKADGLTSSFAFNNMSLYSHTTVGEGKIYFFRQSIAHLLAPFLQYSPTLPYHTVYLTDTKRS